MEHKRREKEREMSELFMMGSGRRDNYLISHSYSSKKCDIYVQKFNNITKK